MSSARKRANGNSFSAAMSADRRSVAFVSYVRDTPDPHTLFVTACEDE